METEDSACLVCGDGLNKAKEQGVSRNGQWFFPWCSWMHPELMESWIHTLWSPTVLQLSSESYHTCYTTAGWARSRDFVCIHLYTSTHKHVSITYIWICEYIYYYHAALLINVPQENKCLYYKYILKMLLVKLSIE